jgi:hypothetical protein
VSWTLRFLRYQFVDRGGRPGGWLNEISGGVLFIPVAAPTKTGSSRGSLTSLCRAMSCGRRAKIPSLPLSYTYKISRCSQSSNNGTERTTMSPKTPRPRRPVPSPSAFRSTRSGSARSPMARTRNVSSVVKRRRGGPCLVAVSTDLIPAIPGRTVFWHKK